MTALLTFQVESEGTITDAVDMLRMEFNDILKEFGDRLTVVKEKDTVLGVGVPASVAIKIEMKSLTKELLDEFRPIFRLVARILEKYTENKIVARITFSDGEIEESYEL